MRFTDRMLFVVIVAVVVFVDVVVAAAVVPAGSPSRGRDAAVYVFDTN